MRGQFSAIYKNAIATCLGAFMVAATGTGTALTADQTSSIETPTPPIKPIYNNGSTLKPSWGWVGRPAAYDDFCKNLPHECLPYERVNQVVALNDALWRQILQINKAANLNIDPKNDNVMYGDKVTESWNYPESNPRNPENGRLQGDCEDYVLDKRRALLRIGIPASALRIAVVKRIKANYDGHAVLIVKTDHGDFVLDNLHDKVLAVSETRDEFQFYSMQSGHNPKSWVIPKISTLSVAGN